MNVELPSWWPDWRGETIVLVASGPSATEVDLNRVRGKAKVIAVNNSWQLAPWADILFAADHTWWHIHDGCMDFQGIKVMTQRYRRCPPEWNINVLPFRDIDAIIWRPGTLGRGENSGFQAFNLAVQLEPARILLVGYDLTLEYGIHWHDLHLSGLSNPTNGKIGRWRKIMDEAAKPVAAAGIEVFNCSSISALTQYRYVSFNEATAGYVAG